MRRQEAWIDLADRLGLSRANTVAVCVFLNMKRSTAWIAKTLHIARVDVDRIAVAAKPLLRQSRRADDRPAGDPACVYCGTERDITKDHVLPKSRGGQRKGNLVWACRNCNSAKGDRTPQEWLGEA